METERQTQRQGTVETETDMQTEMGKETHRNTEVQRQTVKPTVSGQHSFTLGVLHSEALGVESHYRSMTQMNGTLA